MSEYIHDPYANFVERIIDKKMQQEKKNRPYSIEEMMLYDEVFDEWDRLMIKTDQSPIAVIAMELFLILTLLLKLLIGTILTIRLNYE